MWKLTRGREQLRCIISTHHQGWRLQLVQDRGLHRSKICRTPSTALKASGEWRQQATLDGWW
jgi:hypothetical protein